jgi:NTP pyrophosphatase (non-canonical NTP hydrolase)
MSESKLELLLNRIDKFNKDRDWDQFHSPVNLSKSISIEAGELLECFQWSNDKYEFEEVKEELADVMNYCLQMCNVLHVDPIDIINKKIDKNEKKYPVEKAKGKSTKYSKL